jgi:hypothetical protein
MEGRSLLRIILTGLVGLAIVVLIIVLIGKIFGGGGSAPKAPVDITRYEDTASSVTLFVDGAPTQVDQDHRQVRITVSNSQNQIEVMSGYQGNLISSTTYSSNSTAYGVFLQSLKHMNFSKGLDSKALADYRGYCPFGNRYIFTFNDGNVNRFQYWATSCGTTGTYQGQLKNTLHLIKLQIPQSDFSKLTAGVSVGF